MAKGDLKGKTLPNKKLKCWMMKNAKNGVMYRTCATPEKKKGPKKQVRGAPRPANQRKTKYLVAYPNGRPKPAKKATKPAIKAKPKPPAKQAKMTVKQAERAKELMNKAKKKIAENKAKKAPAKPKPTDDYKKPSMMGHISVKEATKRLLLEKAKKTVAKAGGKVSKSMPKKTHSMPDGTKMTGTTHTANSKPVKKETSYSKKKRANELLSNTKLNKDFQKYNKSQNWIDKYSSPNLTKRFKNIKTEEQLRNLMNTLKQELTDKQMKTNEVMRKMNEEVGKLNKKDPEHTKKLNEIVKNKKDYEKKIKNIVNIMMDLFNDRKNEISKN